MKTKNDPLLPIQRDDIPFLREVLTNTTITGNFKILAPAVARIARLLDKLAELEEAYPDGTKKPGAVE